MQYLIIRKPIVHTNPIVEKEETNKKLEQSLSKTAPPWPAQPKKVTSSVGNFSTTPGWTAPGSFVNPENATSQRCTGGGGTGS